MQHDEWHDSSQQAFACRIDASESDVAPGSPTHGCRHLLIAFNPEAEETAFALPAGSWTVALDSAGVLAAGAAAQTPLILPAHALVVLRQTPETTT
jgi:pullulanase/glycogen debranching enzyme